MALTKNENIIEIKILENNDVEIVTKTIIKDGDVFVAENLSTRTITKYDSVNLDSRELTDISGESAKVQSVCAIAFE
tara:strand:+ start:249 stop:479 length:231 start_codon:yes stop_codon:yes gene_type:complete